jgi:hypothetical protein
VKIISRVRRALAGFNRALAPHPPPDGRAFTGRGGLFIEGSSERLGYPPEEAAEEREAGE